MKAPLFLLCFLAILPSVVIQAEEVPEPPSKVFESAGALIREGKTAEAEAKIRIALEKLQAEVGPDHPAVGYFQSNLALFHASQGRYPEAARLAESTALLFEKNLPLGRENPHSMFARWTGAAWAAKAKQPAKAAELLGPLHATLKEYVASGRAQRADWEAFLKDHPGLLNSLPKLDESGVATVAAGLGQSLAEAGRADEALPILDEAAASLERLFGPGHPVLVEVHESLEKIARSREEKGVRHYVGSFGRSRGIEFEGNVTFPPEVLRKALTQDLTFVLASHPSERFDKFLPVIAERLRCGYRHCGFPDAKVTASYRSTGERQDILVSITEGPRFRQGEIQIEGAAGIDRDLLVAGLRKTDEGKGAISYADRIRALMDSHAKDLPLPDAMDPEATAAGINGQVPSFSLGEKGPAFTEDPALAYLKKVMSSGWTQPGWASGEPLAFDDDGEAPMMDRVVACLADQGKPLAKVTTAHERRATGTVDLIVRIEDAGPQAVIGKVTVEGNSRNSAEEISRVAGLGSGQPVTPARLDEAVLALWRTGRFFPFAIDKRPRGGGRPEIDFHIRVRELEHVPPLATPATPDQETVLRFIEWINSGMPGEELLIERQDPEFGRLFIGWSPRDRSILDFTLPRDSAGVSLVLSGESASVAVRQGPRAHAARLTRFARQLGGTFHIIPDNSGKNRLAISSALGFSSSSRDVFFNVDLLFTPAYVFLKPDEIRRDGDRVVVSPAITEYSLELEAATGRPLAAKAGERVCGIRTAPGSVRERQQQLEAEIATLDPTPSATGWWDAVAALLQGNSAPGGVIQLTEPMLDSARKTAQLIDLLGKPRILKPLLEWYDDFTGQAESTDGFTIPIDPARAQSGGTMSLLAGFGYLWLTEEYLPDAAWAGTFARELMFILGGKTQHTAQVMNALLADPAIGPYGSLVCAQLLDKLDPATARRFRMKARQQCSAEGFRKDWQLFADSPAPVGRAFGGLLEAVAGFSPEDEAKAAGLLPEDASAWLRPFLQDLRQRPADQPWSGWIAPHMDRLWNESLGTRLREHLDHELSPPAKPAEVAATVDGVSVQRFVVKALREQHLGPLRALSLPEFQESRPWTKDLALAGAVRLILIRNYIQDSGRYPSDPQIEAFLSKNYPDLSGKPDEDWIQRTGLDRTRYGQWAALVGGVEILQAEWLEKFAEPPDDQVLRDYYQARAATYARKVDTDMVFIPSTQATPAELARYYEQAVELGKSLRGGKSVAALQESGELDAIPGSQAFSREAADMGSFQFGAMKAIAALKVGEATEPMEMGRGVALFVLRASRQDQAPDFDEAKEMVLEHWRAEMIGTEARKWFEERESAAEVKVLEAPPVPEEGSKAAGAQAPPPAEDGEETIESLEKKLAQLEKSKGPDDESLIPSLLSLAQLQASAALLEAAAGTNRRALQIAKAKLGEEHIAVANLLNNLAMVLLEQGKPAEAEVMLRESLAIAKKSPPHDPVKVVKALNNLGGCLLDQAKDAEAESTYREALALNSKLPAGERASEAFAWSGLGLILSRQSKFAEAETLLRRALSEHKKHEGAEHPDVATSLSNLARVIIDQSRHAEAETLLREALAIRRKVFGEEHPDIASLLNNLGFLVEERGRYTEAESLYREALAMWGKLVGAEHPQVAAGLRNLAGTLRERGRGAEAEALYRESLAIRRKISGGEHPATALGLESLAVCLRSMGRFAEAEKLVREALGIYQKVHGEKHVELLWSLHFLSVVLGDQGNYAAAEQTAREALAISRTGADDDRFVAGSLLNLAQVLEYQGKAAEAVKACREALVLRKGQVSVPSLEQAEALESLGESLASLGDYAEAAQRIREGLDLRTKLQGPGHPDVAIVLGNLAEVRRRQGEPAEALKLLQEAAAIQSKLLEKDHLAVAKILEIMAKASRDLAKYAEADPLFESALIVLKARCGEAHRRYGAALGEFAESRRRQGRFADARPLAERALAIQEKALPSGHPELAATLDTLAGIHTGLGSPQVAADLNARAKAIREKAIADRRKQ